LDKLSRFFDKLHNLEVNASNLKITAATGRLSWPDFEPGSVCRP